MSQAPSILHKVPRPVVIGELQTVVDYNVTPEQKQRRERMIDFLENECPVEAFTLNATDVPLVEIERESIFLNRPLRAHCGTVGCAIGHGRRLFRTDFVSTGHYITDGMAMLGLLHEQAKNAFTPCGPDDYDATPQQVATRLREAFRRHPAAI